MEAQSIENPTISQTHKVTFGDNIVWLDCVDNYSQSDIWLELDTADIADTVAYLKANGINTCDELEQLPGNMHWIQDPAGNVFLVANKQEEEGYTLPANKQTVHEYMEAFHTGNNTKVLDCLTDDIVWEIPGHTSLQGKEAFSREINNGAFEGKPVIKVLRLIEENNIVIAEGSVQSRLKDGPVIDLVFCDVFELVNSKIKKLTSYLVQLNQQLINNPQS